MFRLKTLSLVTLILLLQSCSNKPRMYDLTGIWEAECININDNNRYDTKTAYIADGSFESQSRTRNRSAFFSGTYKASKTRLYETYLTSSNPRQKGKLPIKQTSEIKWINDNSILISTIDDKCTASRVTDKL